MRSGVSIAWRSMGFMRKLLVGSIDAGHAVAQDRHIALVRPGAELHLAAVAPGFDAQGLAGVHRRGKAHGELAQPGRRAGTTGAPQGPRRPATAPTRTQTAA